jgi:hypothetical protein
MYASARFVCFGARQDTERNLARPQGFDALDGGDETASGWHDRGNRNAILLFNIGIAQSEFEGGELIAMDTDSALVAFVDPVTRSSGFALMELAVAAIVDAEVVDGLDSSSLTELTGFMWMAVVTVCVAPLVAVALIGEVAKVRAFAWYSGATGMAAASAPWLIRVALRLPRAIDYSSVELRFALIFFFTGLISGSVYWFLAGRSADGRRAI